jgi:hypothetical protein
MVSAADNIELQFELPAELPSYSPEQRVRYAAALRRLAAWLNEQANEIDGDVLLTVQEAAALVGRTEEAVRVWARHGLGEFDPVAHRYLIRRSRLVAHVLATQGVLPAGLLDYEACSQRWEDGRADSF